MDLIFYPHPEPSVTRPGGNPTLYQGNYKKLALHTIQHLNFDAKGGLNRSDNTSYIRLSHYTILLSHYIPIIMVPPYNGVFPGNVMGFSGILYDLHEVIKPQKDRLQMIAVPLVSVSKGVIPRFREDDYCLAGKSSISDHERTCQKGVPQQYCPAIQHIQHAKSAKSPRSSTCYSLFTYFYTWPSLCSVARGHSGHRRPELPPPKKVVLSEPLQRQARQGAMLW